VIVDCRPHASALANRANGGGYEGKAYTDTYAKITWMNIQNIHHMRKCMESLQQLCMARQNDKDLRWNAAVEGTDWLYHVR
jgi:hypothetical protein